LEEVAAVKESLIKHVKILRMVGRSK
jgi:hypothetical protein